MPQILPQVAEGIFTEIKNKFDLLKEDQQLEILRRRLLCETCPMNSKNRAHNPTTSGHTCSGCGCDIILKTSCLSCHCGAAYHNSIFKNDLREVKWEPYADQ